MKPRESEADESEHSDGDRVAGEVDEDPEGSEAGEAHSEVAGAPRPYAEAVERTNAKINMALDRRFAPA